MGWRTALDGDRVRHQVSALDPRKASTANVSPRKSAQGIFCPCSTFLEPFRESQLSRRKKQAPSSIHRGKCHTSHPAYPVDRLQRHTAAPGIEVSS